MSRRGPLLRSHGHSHICVRPLGTCWRGIGAEVRLHGGERLPYERGGAGVATLWARRGLDALIGWATGKLLLNAESN